VFIKLKHNAHLVVFIQLLYYFNHIPKEPYANSNLHRLFSGIFRCLASLILSLQIAQIYRVNNP